MISEGKYRISFKDQHQDLTHMDLEVLGEFGTVLSAGCTGLLNEMYSGLAFQTEEIKIGGFITPVDPKNGFTGYTIKYPIVEIEPIK